MTGRLGITRANSLARVQIYRKIILRTADQNNMSKIWTNVYLPPPLNGLSPGGNPAGDACIFATWPFVWSTLLFIAKLTFAGPVFIAPVVVPVGRPLAEYGVVRPEPSDDKMLSRRASMVPIPPTWPNWLVEGWLDELPCILFCILELAGSVFVSMCSEGMGNSKDEINDGAILYTGNQFHYTRHTISYLSQKHPCTANFNR